VTEKNKETSEISVIGAAQPVGLLVVTAPRDRSFRDEIRQRIHVDILPFLRCFFSLVGCPILGDGLHCK
jgi:hypothetical protein